MIKYYLKLMEQKIFYLTHRRFVKVQLQLLCEILETVGAEDDGVLGHPVVAEVLPAVDRLEDAHSSSGHPVKPESNMISMSRSTIFNDNLSLTIRPGQILQILQFIDGCISPPGIVYEVYEQLFQGMSNVHLLSGDLPSSAVGILCSPGLIHSMGPSLLLFLSSLS